MTSTDVCSRPMVVSLPVVMRTVLSISSAPNQAACLSPCQVRALRHEVLLILTVRRPSETRPSRGLLARREGPRGCWRLESDRPL